MSEFTNRLATYLVLRIKRKVIGYIGYWYLFEEAHITTFAIHPDYRRQGLGKIPSICSEFNFESGLSGSFS